MTSFTKSIDSNLKLLRVILLTKGASIMEFGLLLEKGEELLDEENSEFMQAVQKKKNVVRNKIKQKQSLIRLKSAVHTGSKPNLGHILTFSSQVLFRISPDVETRLPQCFAQHLSHS